jgi:hypothetical protein
MNQNHKSPESKFNPHSGMGGYGDINRGQNKPWAP